MTEKTNPINYSFRENISKEEIPNTTYLTHGIYSYPAKFIPHVPYFVIKKFAKGTNNIIIDPFGGSSTTAIEAIKSRNNCIIMDNNPITDILAKAKTMKLDFCLGKISKIRLSKNMNLDDFIVDLTNNSNNFNNTIDPEDIVLKIKENDELFFPNWKNIDHWVEPEFKDILGKIWGYIHFKSNHLNDSFRTLLIISALYVTKKFTNGALDVPKLYKSKLRIKQIEEIKKKFETDKDIMYEMLLKRIYLYYKQFKTFSDVLDENDINVKYFDKTNIDKFNFEEFKDNERFVLSLGDVDSINYIFPEKFNGRVDILITSPPYVYAQEYIRSSKLDMYWLNLIDDVKATKLAKTEIGHRKNKDLEEIINTIGKIDSFKKSLDELYRVELEKYGKNGKYTNQIINYFYDMFKIMKNMKKILKDKGIFAFFVGNPTVLGVKLPCCDIFIDFLLDIGYTIKEYGYDPIISRALMKGRNNASPDGMEYEWLIFAENHHK